jgi:hypothetical protein
VKSLLCKFLCSLLVWALMGCYSSTIAQPEMTIRVVPPISNTRILPADKVTSGQISSKLNVVACRGEYEPTSFVVMAGAKIHALQVRADDLKGPGGVIPADQIDIKVIKCWCQSGSKGEEADKEMSKRVLVPALLLNDDSLIKVDCDRKENYLKSPVDSKEKYIWVSNPNEKEGDNPKIPSEKFLLKDASKLLPVNIPANTNKQFFVTVHVPEDARAGRYSGRITLSTSTARIDLTLELHVLPFKLLGPYYTSSMYYKNPVGYQVVPRYRKEMENMIAHGVTNPIYYPAEVKFEECFMRIRQELGLTGQPLFTIQNGADLSPDDVKKYLKWASSYGYTSVYFYGIDEAHSHKLVSELPGWQRTKKAGGHTFASGAQEAGSSETYGKPDSYFQTVGDALDVFINGRTPTREQAALWHSRGKKIWSYANPHVGHDDPVVYRRNYGLLLWKNNYDGVGLFAYQFISGNPYNDFDGNMRELNFVYPTSDGVIDTVAWEGYREGIDDVRYVTTLTKAIENAKASSDPKRKILAIDAQKYLETLDVEQRDLDTIRMEIIGYLLKL